jgi:hypothetical protein
MVSISQRRIFRERFGLLLGITSGFAVMREGSRQIVGSAVLGKYDGTLRHPILERVSLHFSHEIRHLIAKQMYESLSCGFCGAGATKNARFAMEITVSAGPTR